MAYAFMSSQSTSTHMVAKFGESYDGAVVRGKGALWVTEGLAEHVGDSHLKVVSAGAETPASTRLGESKIDISPLVLLKHTL